jgi:hypothetical protein
MWRASAILAEIVAHLSRFHSGLERLTPVLAQPAYAAVAEDVYRQLAVISINHGVTKRNKRRKERTAPALRLICSGLLSLFLARLTPECFWTVERLRLSDQSDSRTWYCMAHHPLQAVSLSFAGARQKSR